jgi:hypothetical protein
MAASLTMASCSTFLANFSMVRVSVAATSRSAMVRLFPWHRTVRLIHRVHPQSPGCSANKQSVAICQDRLNALPRDLRNGTRPEGAMHQSMETATRRCATSRLRSRRSHAEISPRGEDRRVQRSPASLEKRRFNTCKDPLSSVIV